MFLINVLDYIKVKYIVNCFKMFDYKRIEFEKLWVMLVILFYVYYDDIFVFGVKNGCVIVIFMLWNCLVLILKIFYMLEKISMIC